jgi:hypothetical protein
MFVKKIIMGLVLLATAMTLTTTVASPLPKGQATACTI